MRILLVTTVMPHRMRLGGEVVTQNFVDAIGDLGHTCDLVAYRHHGDDSPLPANFHSAGAWHIETEMSGARPYWWLARSVLYREPYLCSKFRSGNLLRTARSLLAEHRYDCLILDHTNLGWLLDPLDFDGPVVFVAHNLESRLYADEAASHDRYGALKRAVYAREAEQLRRMESRLRQRCRQVWTLTEEERQAYSGIGPGAAHPVLSFDIPGKALQPAGGMPAHASIDVGLLGGWVWNVNRAGLDWFMREVVSRLPSSLRIEVAGKGADFVPNPYENVVYRGFVDSALGFLRSCRVIVVPSTTGAGVQVKTIEGIGAGVPLISTPVGLRGIRPLPEYVSCASSAEDMAALIVERVRAPLPHDPSGGANWAQARVDSFRTQLSEALNRVVSRP